MTPRTATALALAAAAAFLAGFVIVAGRRLAAHERRLSAYGTAEPLDGPADGAPNTHLESTCSI